MRLRHSCTAVLVRDPAEVVGKPIGSKRRLRGWSAGKNLNLGLNYWPAQPKTNAAHGRELRAGFLRRYMPLGDSNRTLRLLFLIPFFISCTTVGVIRQTRLFLECLPAFAFLSFRPITTFVFRTCLRFRQ